MTPQAHRVYELLPAFHRIRDAEAGYPLRSLLALIGEQIDVVEEGIAQQYADWFIETCADWATPYIGDLVGYRPSSAAGRPSDVGTVEAGLLNNAISPRAEIANVLAFRRRKGTLSLLELLGTSVADWPARAVEFYALLCWTQHVSHVRLDRGRLVDLRDGDVLDRLSGPFDSLAHTVDVRSLASRRTRGRPNISGVGVFAWRLKTYSVSHAPGYCAEGEGSQCYTFSILGNDAPLYARAAPEAEPTQIAQEDNLPVAIRRRALEHRIKRRPLTTEASAVLYGKGKSIAIYAPGWPEKGAPQPVPNAKVVPADLSDWRYRAHRGQILVDPALGRMVFPARQPPKQGVWVDYRYAFSADIGGGEYHRPLAQPAAYRLYQVSRDHHVGPAFRSINEALLKWRRDQKQGQPDAEAAVIEIIDSAAYSERLALELGAGEYLQIRAADRTRPVIRLLDYMAERPDAFTVVGRAGSRLVLDGLLIAGRGIHIAGPDVNDDEDIAQGDLCDVIIRHSTLVPGWGLNCDCEPTRPSEASLELVDCSARITISHSILGAIEVVAEEVQSDPVSISLTDTILDATGDSRASIRAANLPLAFAHVSFARCTVFGRVEVHAIPLAENTIFSGQVRVARRQLGCMRFCYVPPARSQGIDDAIMGRLLALADEIDRRQGFGWFFAGDEGAAAGTASPAKN